jgi:hypothetical protein
MILALLEFLTAIRDHLHPQEVTSLAISSPVADDPLLVIEVNRYPYNPASARIARSQNASRGRRPVRANHVHTSSSCFELLHARQAGTMFPGVVRPPFDTASMWSQVVAGSSQYAQSPSNKSRIISCASGGMGSTLRFRRIVFAMHLARKAGSVRYRSRWACAWWGRHRPACTLFAGFQSAQSRHHSKPALRCSLLSGMDGPRRLTPRRSQSRQRALRPSLRERSAANAAAAGSHDLHLKHHFSHAATRAKYSSTVTPILRAAVFTAPISLPDMQSEVTRGIRP